MLEELKKINRLGDKGDIILFLKSVIGRQRLYRKDIQKKFVNILLRGYFKILIQYYYIVNI